jgi:hypothetical protein
MADGRIELGGNCVLTASHPEQLPTELYTCEQLLKRLCISHHTDTPMFRNQQLGVACVSLHHTSRSDGMKIRSRHTRVPSLLLTQQLTALLWFPDGNDECQLIEAELRLYDPELCPQIGHFPLSVDVSVPLLTHFHYTRSWTMRRVQEYFSQMPVIRPLALMIPAVSGWRQVNRYRLQQKLYAIHPFQPWKRPLILVHGFLSNPLTWYFLAYAFAHAQCIL